MTDPVANPARWSSRLVVCLEAAKDTLVQRLLGRGQEQGRGDDTAATIERRIDVYFGRTAAVIAHYQRAGVKVAIVDGAGTVAEVRQRVLLGATALSARLTPSSAGR